jgi:two-component system sensor histidine kinase VicK
MTRSEGGSPPEAAPTAEDARTTVSDDILKRLPLGIVMCDRNLRVEFANAAAADLLGADDLAPGSPLEEHWGDLDVRSYAAELFSTDVAPEPELAGVGSRTLLVNGLPAGAMDTAIFLITEVTERERRQRADRHFLENAAHELRTPVAAIVSVAEALESAKDEPDARDRFLAHLRVHSDRLVRLATSLLALARVQSGVEEPRLELVPLAAFLDDIVAHLDHVPAVAVEVEAADGVAALADRELLRLIVSNIAQNSVKNTHVGSIRFAARSIDGRTELEIADTGSGMSAADRDAAFDRFHRGSDSSEGFGLGLAIARDAAEELGGTLELESTPGEGTVVRIGLRSAEVIS